MTYEYYLAFSPKEGSQVNFQPSYEDTQRDPNRNFFPTQLLNEVLSTLRPLPEMKPWSEKTFASLDGKEIFNRDFPRNFPGGKYSLLDEGWRMNMLPSELDTTLNGGEVQYRKTESPLTRKE